MADYGVVKAWGDNSLGQSDGPSPNADCINIAAGGFHGLAITDKGEVLCWGNNASGQCDMPSESNSNILGIAAGVLHSMALNASGTIIPFGWDYYGQGTIPSPNEDFTAIAAKGNHSMALRSDGSVECWGEDSYGEGTVPSPNTGFIAIGAGAQHSMGIKANGTVYTWGLDIDGLGTVPSNGGYTKVDGGNRHSVGLTNTGELIAWGNDTYNQVTNTPSGSNYVDIAANSSYSLALRSDGVIVGWGLGPNGEIGSISSETPFSYISAGDSFAAGLAVAKVLIYTGTYNDGSDYGTANLSNSVISIGRISEVLMGGANRPWCQQTQVVLDDSDSFFIGTLANGTDWYDGTFNIWGLDNGSWAKLLTGFVPASSWTYNYSEKIASLSLTSMLARAATINMGFGSAIYTDTYVGGAVYDTFSNFFMESGTITGVSDGTVTARKCQAFVPWPPTPNAYFWSDLDTPGAVDTNIQGPGRLESYKGWEETTYGTWTIEYQFSGGTQDWMSVGRQLVRTVPFPNHWSLSGEPIGWLFEACGSRMGLSWDGSSFDKFTSDLAIIPLAYTPPYGTVPYYSLFPNSLGEAPLYYGGGLWYETMNDLMNSVGANWTVDGNGVIRAKVKRAAALEAVTGTVSFTDAEDNLTASWEFRSTEGPSNVMVEHEWDNTDERLTGTALAVGSLNTGEVMTQQAKWQRGIGGALLAERLMKWEQRVGRIFALSYPVSYWGSFVPGSLVALSNIPNALNPDYNASGSSALLTAGKYVVQARHYDYMEEKIIAELRQVPPLTGVFILDISELDGPDKLY